MKKVDICSRALKAQARPPSPSSAGLWPRPGHLPKVSALVELRVTGQFTNALDGVAGGLGIRCSSGGRD